jgi:two-component system, OmpR family, response regulator VicR
MGNMAYKVLYIEDQPEAIELVRLALRRIDCEVVGAPDGLQGLKLMRQLQPDLVLLDLMLPGWDGWQVREAMGADPELTKIPVVLVTARVANTDPTNGRCLPKADAYVTKPYSLAEIRNTVQSALALRFAASPAG